jgi:hypothetical protein
LILRRPNTCAFLKKSKTLLLRPPLISSRFGHKIQLNLY